MPIKKIQPIDEWIDILKRQVTSGSRMYEREDVIRERIEDDLRRSEEMRSRSDDEPVSIEQFLRKKWFYKGYIYEIDNARPYTDDQIRLLILEDYDKERKKIEKLMRLYKSGAVEEESYRRERLPEDVRIAVWRRDGGKCVRCGSREKLEYDHIVPVSKGGSNTARNIELLCETCNRKKSNNIE
jgi:hypothetical protein